MTYSLGIKPFKDFWINCVFNMKFSILISIEPSFKYNSYLNNYIYEVLEIETSTGTKVNYLNLSALCIFDTSWKSDSLFSSEPINFKHDNNYLNLIKRLVSEGNMIVVGVDLFYWIPNSICWNKHHWNHYSLINGFNDEKKVFYVLDENRKGFNEYEIPEERFCLAINNSTLDPNGFICKVSNDIKRFKLSLDDVIINSRKLIDNLNKMKNNSLFQFSNRDLKERHMMDLFAMYISQIENRQKANKLLFYAMQDEKLITENDIMDTLIKYAIELHDYWSIVKSKFVKVYFSYDNQSAIIEINEICDSLFCKEQEMWNKLLGYTQNME